MKVYILFGLKETYEIYERYIVGVFATEKAALKMSVGQKAPYIEEWKVTK